MGKKEYLIDELGEGTVELMRNVKHAIDPLNIMNPTKVSNVPPKACLVLADTSVISAIP